MTEQTSKFHFTQAAIEALQAEPKRKFYYDSSVRGLAVLVEPTGRKTFYFYRRVGRTTKQLRLGLFPEMKLPAARDKATMMGAAVAAGEEPERVRAGRRGERTLAEVFEWYLEAHAKPRKVTWEQDIRIFDYYVRKGLGNKPLSAITRAVVRQWHGALGVEKSHPIANRSLVLVSSIFTQAIANDIHQGEHPCRGVQPFKAVPRDRRVMPHEVRRFFEVLDNETSVDIRDYVYLSLFTGQRKTNVLAMRWDQVDLAARLWRIPRTKNGLPLVVPLLDTEVAILERRQAAGGEWVFPGKGKNPHMVFPYHGWWRLVDAAGMKGLTLHDLRRTLASFMVDTGASLPVIGKTLGHEHQASTQIYARLSLDPVKEAKARAIAAMMTAGRGQEAGENNA